LNTTPAAKHAFLFFFISHSIGKNLSSHEHTSADVMIWTGLRCQTWLLASLQCHELDNPCVWRWQI